MESQQFESPLFFLNTENAFGTYSRHLARAYGLTCACMLAELVKQHDFHRHQLTTHPKLGPGWFWHTMDNILFQTGMSREVQDSALRKLKKLGLVEIETFGLPAKRHFRLNTQKLIEFFDDLSGRNQERGNPQSGQKSTSFHSQVCGIPQSCPGDSTISPIIYIKETEEKETKRKRKYAPQSSTNCSTPPAGGSAPPDGGAHTHSFEDSFYQSSDSSQSAAGPQGEKKITRAPQVATTETEHNKLLEMPEATEQLVQEAYEDLAEWKASATPAQVKKHSSDYRRLRKWVIPALIEEKQSQEKRQWNKLSPHRRNSKLALKQDLQKDDYDWSRNQI